ncbi:agmatine deiminase family protein [Bradyrhizobium sp. USDA 372]
MPVIGVPFVGEGGAFEGRGLAVATRTCLLARNPHLSEAGISATVRALGMHTTIWLEGDQGEPITSGRTGISPSPRRHPFGRGNRTRSRKPETRTRSRRPPMAIFLPSGGSSRRTQPSCRRTRRRRRHLSHLLRHVAG